MINYVEIAIIKRQSSGFCELVQSPASFEATKKYLCVWAAWEDLEDAMIPCIGDVDAADNPSRLLEMGTFSLIKKLTSH